MEVVTDRAGDRLTRSVSRMGGILFSQEAFEDVVQLVVDLACETVTAADAASVTLRRRGCLETSAFSDQVVLALDEAQYEANDGPCVQALDEGTVVHATDGLARWPPLSQRAREAGIRSVLSTPLSTGGDPLASLNLYSRSPEFDDEARHLNSLFVGPASTTLANAMAFSAASQLADNLREAITTREIIGEAKGILIARQNCSSDEAFDVLRRASQRTNRKLRDIAVDLVQSSERKPSRGDGRPSG
jgi:GAF domain-containing protein